ncbi:mitogen-activated protein kinase kinase kinase 5-like protein [Tanacetum coccineum]
MSFLLLLQSESQKDSNPNLALAVDIWSLACTITEKKNGKPPWSEFEVPAAMLKGFDGSVVFISPWQPPPSPFSGFSGCCGLGVVDGLLFVPILDFCWDFRSPMTLRNSRGSVRCLYYVGVGLPVLLENVDHRYISVLPSALGSRIIAMVVHHVSLLQPLFFMMGLFFAMSLSSHVMVAWFCLLIASAYWSLIVALDILVMFTSE